MSSGLFPKTIPQLDGVRGLAILLVLLSHAAGYGLLALGGWARHGWLGVDLFFVLSGFLITGILADARGRPRYFRNFYGRRLLRIVPVYAVVLLACYGLMRLAVLPENAAAYAWLPYVLLVQNVVFSGPGFHALGATWSLAVEEHFYLVWPWLVRRLEVKWLVAGLVLVVALSPAARWLAWQWGWSHFLLFKHTLLRLDGLALGALLALWVRSSRFQPALLRRAAWGAIAVGVPLSLWMLANDAYWAGLQNKTPISLACAGLVGVALLASREGGIASKLLALPPLRFAGRISYCLYLVHIPVLVIVKGLPVQERITAVAGDWSVQVTLALFLAASVGTATLSWYWFERPILGWKRHFADTEKPAPSQVAAASV